MSINDKLMKDDYVQIIYNSKKIYVKVISQYNDVITILIEPENVEIEYNILDIKSIPLTEEFLYKNSYRVYRTPNYTQYCFNDIYTIKEIDGIFNFNGIILKYVHEFQHWLYLCNIEKEIEL